MNSGKAFGFGAAVCGAAVYVLYMLPLNITFGDFQWQGGIYSGGGGRLQTPKTEGVPKTG